jgi:glycosyltransferase involved in cell wall biosynthesis
LDLRVFFTWSQSEAGQQFDGGFGQSVTWDIPLRDGYAQEFVPNTATDPGLHRFGGLRNPELATRIEHWGADAVLVYGWNHASHLQAMRHFKGRLPVLFRGDSTLLDPQPALRKFLRHALLRWVYRDVDLALAVGQNSRDYFRWCGLTERQVAIAPHCIDNARFAAAEEPALAQARAWRNALAGDDAAIAVVFAGKLQPKKDPGLLIEAVRGLQGGVKVYLFGSGELEGELRAKAAGHPDFAFLPFANQSQMPAVYRTGDLFVLPSRGPGETWGLALNEAMACGRAVIASDRVGGARDLIEHGRNGWVFPAGDVRALRAVLREARNLGRTGLAEMGARAQAHIAGWSVQASATAMARAVQGLLER